MRSLGHIVTMFVFVVCSLGLGVAPALAQGLAGGPPVDGTAQPFEVGSLVATTVGAERGAKDGGGSQAAVADQEEGVWRWVFGGYLHAVDISGTNTVGDVEIPIEVSFSDLFGALKVPFSMHVEGGQGSWGFGADFLYIVVGEEGIEPVPGLGVSVGGDFTIANAELFGTYRFGNPEERGGAFDVIAGARWRRLSLDLTISGLPSELSGGFDESWWDLLLGGRYIAQVHPRAGLVFRADFGKDIWIVNGGVGINVWRRFDMLIEYRYIRINHEQGSGASFFAYDATEQGPLFGFAVHF